MKLRHPVAIRWAARLGAVLIRFWIGSLQIRYHALGPYFPRHSRRFPGRYLYIFWHESILFPAYLYGNSFVHVLISEHADGQLIAEICQRLGFSVVRGSTTRGGVRALRTLAQLPDSQHAAITPDGPRGPRRVIQPGVIYVAARTGMPIIPLGVACPKAWRARSWDRFLLPRPASRAYLVSGEPVVIPAAVTGEAIETYRQRAQDALDHVNSLAEQWAATGQPPAPRLGAADRQSPRRVA